MNRYVARTIAEKITNQQLKEMFDLAQANIKDWQKVSNINKSLTKGTAWNILAVAFKESDSHSLLAKTNMVREFGEFLPDQVKTEKKSKPIIIPVHQEPKF